ncbi:MAG: hypothetical protein NVV73_05425 [Cellvibrionaceae bacterium]|nr:hypothetical protein [Cellvibrionaceae bacterium]
MVIVSGAVLLSLAATSAGSSYAPPSARVAHSWAALRLEKKDGRFILPY